MSPPREDPRWPHAVALRGAIRWTEQHVATTRGLSPEQHVGARDAGAGIEAVLVVADVRDRWAPSLLDGIDAGTLRSVVAQAGAALVEGLGMARQGALAACLVLALDGIDRMFAPPRADAEGQEAEG